MWQTIIQEVLLMLYIIKYSSTVPVHVICTLSFFSFYSCTLSFFSLFFLFIYLFHVFNFLLCLLFPKTFCLKTMLSFFFFFLNSGIRKNAAGANL